MFDEIHHRIIVLLVIGTFLDSYEYDPTDKIIHKLCHSSTCILDKNNFLYSFLPIRNIYISIIFVSIVTIRFAWRSSRKVRARPFDVLRIKLSSCQKSIVKRLLLVKRNKFRFVFLRAVRLSLAISGIVSIQRKTLFFYLSQVRVTRIYFPLNLIQKICSV